MRAWRRHLRALWPRFPWAPVAPYWIWVAFWRARAGLRWDHVAMALAATGLAYGNRRTKTLFVALVPLSAVAMLYDGMRLLKNTGLTTTNVHVGDIRARRHDHTAQFMAQRLPVGGEVVSDMQISTADATDS